MKRTVKRALALLLSFAVVLTGVPVSAAEKSADNFAVSAEKNGDSVVIGNDYISREFSVAGNKVSTTKITNKRTDGGDTVFAPGKGSEEFIIRTTKTVTPGLSKAGWTAYADTYQGTDNDGPPAYLIDGNVGTIWHSAYNSSGAVQKASLPFNIVIDLGKETEFQSVAYTGRGNGSNGRINGYKLYVYNKDGEVLDFEDSAWGTAVATGNFANESSAQYINLAAPVKATQIRIEITSSYGEGNQANQFGSAAEIDLYATAQGSVAGGANDREFPASALTLVDTKIEDTEAVINKEEKSGKMITFSYAPYTFKGVEYTIDEVIVMYDGDHFMRKYMEISVPDEQKGIAEIDYIDLESMVVNKDDAQWTIPTDAGGIVQMDRFKANLGQPIYIQGMFFGCEFPLTDTEIVNGVGYMRYYTGKDFERFEADNQLTKDGKYVTWQTVAGAARSTDIQVIQADFFEYIKSIATPSDFRIQYNSWFDNMMLISDENILESFIEVDKEFNATETRPLDSYVVDDGWINYNDTHVVDANRAGTTLNQTGFWEFNSKFPEGLTPSSDLVHKFGSNFGVWVGPRGGYNFYGSLADILTKSGKGSKAGGAIDVADRTYIKNLSEMFVKWQKDYGVNYWKWDGFSDQAQYNHFAAVDGVPGYANRHMTGGYNHMYHVTDLWEAWIDLFEIVRQSEEEDGINKLWLSLTCYVNPSPWFLQWANSVWLQCTHDQNDAGSSSSKMDRQLTYRDAAYYDFLKNHEFQFPLSNIYNHDPVYGKEGTGMNKNTATDEQFQNYLYMMATRGTAFWELYYSDSLMTPGKYEVNAEFLEWAEENYHMLRNAKMFGGSPNTGTVLGGSSNGTQNAYGFACFDGTNGIVSVRNAATSTKSVTVTFDRTIGVPENAGTLQYHIEHSHNLTANTAATGTFTYGEEYTFTLKPDEVRIFMISKDGDTVAPKMTRAYTDGDKVITVRFDEKVKGAQFEVAGATVASVEQSADDITYRITLESALADGSSAEVVAADITDLAGNVCEDSIVFVHNKDNVVAVGAAKAADSLYSNNGFTVVADVETEAAGTVVAQGEEYELGINEDGTAYFTLNGTKAVSKAVVNDGAAHQIVGVKENNGILKLYVDGELEGAAYNADNRYYQVQQADITVSDLAAAAAVYDIAYGYDEVAEIGTAPEGSGDTEKLPAESMKVSASSVDDTEPAHNKDAANAVDGDDTTFWATAPNGTLADAWYMIELDDVYKINQVDYTKRFDSGAQYNCTGNLLDYIIEVSTDGETWTEVAKGDTVDGTTSITFAPTAAKFVRVRATKSYHWQDSSANTVMTIAELAVYKTIEKSVELPLESMTATAGDWERNGGDEGPADFAIDGDESTKWHTDWYAGDNHDNHWVQVELDGTYLVDGFKYLPRQDSSPNGRITKYDILVSMDGKEWTSVATGEWDTTTDWKEVSFNPTNAKFVRLQTVEATSDQQLKFASAAEIRVVGKPGVACTEHTTELKNVKEATCTEDGYTGDLTCTKCGTVVEAGKVVKSEGHVWGEPVVTEATCTEDGSSVKTCTACGETETEVLKSEGHAWGEWEVVKEATETEDGEKERTCANCGEKETETIPATGTVEPTPTPTPSNPFEDVNETDWFNKAVLWGAENKIVAGLTETKFGPAEVCTRAQIVAFLWRAAGRPEPQNTECPFTDVNEAEFYYKAMLWAVENNIAKGYTEDKFAPSQTCTRAEMATFLWRVDGRKAVEGESPFVDVTAADYFYTPAIWASQNKVVSGYEDGTFAPYNTIARAETVTMLYRYYK